ncbi:hypothetical protein [Roseibium suaedae]|uniref:Uncharacterized protein n=1 Tax=Roseibium suaedae TaxID=735517 RepID=A0A1M7KV00_9HYPH|nr:hypothetical protein [Roseibium suaedae]SHM69436.1 hypothetical protein SAMN05444272_2988 [Roseibium suaedae]
MPDRYADPVAEPIELEFVRGHIAATMTLVLGLIDQGVIDRERLDAFFAGFISELPHTRDTLGLRLVLDQWRDGLRSGRDESQLRQSLFEVIKGGRD